jgi:hypothetical protein
VNLLRRQRDAAGQLEEQWQPKVSIVWLILLSLALGALGGILAAQLDRRRRRRSAGE